MTDEPDFRVLVSEVDMYVHSNGRVWEHQLYRAHLEDDESVCLPAARVPFLEFARLLVKRGEDPDKTITMRWKGKPHDSFVPVPLRVPAGLAVREGDARPRFVKYRPHFRKS